METAARLALLLCSLAVSPCALSCEVALLNATSTDLAVRDDHGRTVMIGPKEMGSVRLAADLWVEFGAEAFNYQVSAGQRSKLCPTAVISRTVLRAEPDASLWLQAPGEQPVGFPLRPAGKIDLTGSPSNTSFKVTRRPVTQFAVANWAPARPAPQLDR